MLIPSLLSIIGMLMVILVPVGAAQWQWTDLWMSFLFIGAALRDAPVAELYAPAHRPGAVAYGCHGDRAGAGDDTAAGAVACRSAFRGIANKQVVWITAGMVALWATVAFLRDLNWLRRYKYTFAIGGILLVAATLRFRQRRGQRERGASSGSTSASSSSSRPSC